VELSVIIGALARANPASPDVTTRFPLGPFAPARIGASALLCAIAYGHHFLLQADCVRAVTSIRIGD
jgi:hypothetical protein